MMPAVGKVMARGREEPVSNFNYTDDEREFRDRAWAIVSPMHGRDWLAANKAELQRTRIVGEVDRTLDPETYYKLLRSDRYQSSEARYERVIHDIRSDQGLLDPFYALLLQVQAADAERIRVVRASMSATPKERHDARARGRGKPAASGVGLPVPAVPADRLSQRHRPAGDRDPVEAPVRGQHGLAAPRRRGQGVRHRRHGVGPARCRQGASVALCHRRLGHDDEGTAEISVG